MAKAKNGNGEKEAGHPVRDTKEAAEQDRPTEGKVSAKLRVHTLTKGGEVVGYTLARSGTGALANVARRDGYSASVTDKQARVSKEAVAAMLAELSDEELAALGVTRKGKR